MIRRGRVAASLACAALGIVGLVACAGTEPVADEVISEIDMLASDIAMQVERLMKAEGLSEEEATERLLGTEIIRGGFDVEQLVALGYSPLELSRMTGGQLAAWTEAPGSLDREALESAGLTVADILDALAAAARELPEATAYDWLTHAGFATADELVAAGVPTVQASAWDEPAQWPGEWGELTGMTVQETRFAVGIDGEILEATIVVEGTPDAAVAAWTAALPDTRLTTHVSSSTASGDTTIWLSSGTDRDMVVEGLPEAWWNVLPLGESDMAYLFAGVEYVVGDVDVVVSADTPAFLLGTPSFLLGLAESNRVDEYRQWLLAQDGWQFSYDDDGQFSAENADFAVQGLRSSDGTDELSITAKRWDIPGLAELQP